MAKVSDGIAVLQNNLSFPLTDDQILKLCNQLKDLKEPFRNKLLVAIYNRKSPVIVDFFKRSVMGENEFATSMLEFGLSYILNYGNSLDIEFFKNFIKSHDHRRGRMYLRSISLTQAFNEKLTIQLLNAKDIIEYVYESEELPDFRRDVLNQLQNSKIPPEVYHNTYFFNRVSNSQ